MKAFSVQGDEQGVIVFAKSHVEARRFGANKMGIEFSDVEGVNRTPGLDVYAEAGDVPPRVLIEDHGWTWECTECYRRVTADCEEDTDERPMDPQYEGHMVFCCPDCQRDYHAEQAARKQRKQDRTRAALEKFPGIEVVWVNDHPTDATVSFRFPGGKQSVDWKVGAATANVARLDHEAFEKFQDSIIAARAAGGQ